MAPCSSTRSCDRVLQLRCSVPRGSDQRSIPLTRSSSSGHSRWGNDVATDDDTLVSDEARCLRELSPHERGEWFALEITFQCSCSVVTGIQRGLDVILPAVSYEATANTFYTFSGVRSLPANSSTLCMHPRSTESLQSKKKTYVQSKNLREISHTSTDTGSSAQVETPRFAVLEVIKLSEELQRRCLGTTHASVSSELHASLCPLAPSYPREDDQVTNSRCCSIKHRPASADWELNSRTLRAAIFIE